MRGGLADDFAGGENKEMYADGMKRNVDWFHQSIVQGVYDNPTVVPAVNSTLATILGREAALGKRHIMWDELLRSTVRLQPELTGLRM